MRVEVLSETSHGLILADRFAAVHVEGRGLARLQLCHSVTQFLTRRCHLVRHVRHLRNDMVVENVTQVGDVLQIDGLDNSTQSSKLKSSAQSDKIAAFNTEWQTTHLSKTERVQTFKTEWQTACFHEEQQITAVQHRTANNTLQQRETNYRIQQQSHTLQNESW